MEFVEGKDLKGFDVDVSKKVAEEAPPKHDWQVMAFEDHAGAEAGRCDVGWSAMYLNDDRQKVADAVPYLNTTAQALVAKGNPLRHPSNSRPSASERRSTPARATWPSPRT